MGAKGSKPKSNTTPTTLTGPELQQAYYKQQFAKDKLRHRNTIIKVLLFVIVITALLLMIRSQFIEIINLMGEFGWYAAISHQYPFMSGLFFRNKETGSAMVNLYYATLQTPPIVQFQNCGDNKVVNCFLNMGNPRGSDPLSTVMGYLENNPENGFSDLITALVKAKTLPSSAQSSSIWGYIKEGLNFVTSYVLPFAMMGVMLASA